MAPENSLWTVPSLQRYRPVLFALAALAAGCTIYYVNETASSRDRQRSQSGSLHRSNASRRRRRTQPARIPEQDAERAQEQEHRGEDPSLLRREHEVWEYDTRTEAASENSWSPDGPGEDSRDGQSLLTLLYRIAEEQNRKDGYVHRGVQCNSCNENPIRGIRYRCVNCTDYDLCEQCEAMQLHPKTHLFYKIRIPAPFIGAHKERQPVLYPGRPKAVTQDLRKEQIDRVCRDTGLKTEEVEAIWEQFRCMAATEWPGDPDDYDLAIDRATFDKCFIPSASTRQLPPNLIYDRIFSYYDTNNDGLIGFEEFVKGLASLKKKNFDERLKRIFNGYDLDGDGFIDRRDVLRMFRSFYALTRDLTTEIVSGMQDDTDEGDARDVILSGQPISSAFTGNIPRGDSSRVGQGKARNALGDDVVIDGQGTLNTEDSQAVFNLDELVAENAERARRGETPKMTSGKEIRDAAFNSDWTTLTSDLEMFLVEVPENCDAEGEYMLRRELQVRLAMDLFHRRLHRRKAIMSRAQRQYFMQDADDKSQAPLNFPLGAGDTLADPRLHTGTSRDLADIKTSPQRITQFHAALDDLIHEMDWPLENPHEFRDSLLRMVMCGWSENAFWEDLNGFAADPSVVKQFVSALGKLLTKVADEVRQEPGFKETFKKVERSNRSRSSSKVRFEDGIGDEEEDEIRSATSLSSRSRPVNERWGGIELPEPEADIGREVIYQVTQEALIELLDPVFRLREDLALHALLTRESRSRYRSQIVAAVASDDDLLDVRNYLMYYQRWWRRCEGIATPSSTLNLHRDEALTFRQHVHDMEMGVEGPLTGTTCPGCKKQKESRFLRIGQSCPNHQSLEVDHYIPPRPFPYEHREKCRHCEQRGKDSWIVDNYCTHCGRPCPRTAAHYAELRRIIAGGEQEQPSKNFRPSEQLMTVIFGGGYVSADEEGQDRSEEQVSVKESDDSQGESPDTALTTPEGQDNESEYPVMAEDLHQSVTTFNEMKVSSVEADITSKPLEELLTNSGYSTVEPQPATSSTNPPSQSTRNDHVPSYTYISPPIDPTLPQNRPNTVNELPSVKHTSGLEKANQMRTKESPLLGNPEKSEVKSSNEVLSKAACKFYATMELLEGEDKQRGGPGRLNFTEFEEIMKGAKGPSLGFLASWVEVGGF